MALTRVVNSVSRPAGADLSTHQYKVLMVEDDGQVNINTSIATACFGILLNKPSAANQAARVAINGSIVKCLPNSAINERDAIIGTAGGFASATTTDGHFIIGFALTAAAASAELFELEVNPQIFGTAP